MVGTFATGKDKPAAAVGVKALGSPAASVHYDPELEKQRLAFEMQKYEKAERLRLETVRLQKIADEKAECLRLEAKVDAERLRLEAVRLQQIEDR